jgi:hypothetical protein
LTVKTAIGGFGVALVMFFISFYFTLEYAGTDLNRFVLWIWLAFFTCGALYFLIAEKWNKNG